MSLPHPQYTREEMMTIAAARRFRDRATCFVGVGLPSVAACLAREQHAPRITLIYESGSIGAKPTMPPLSIADPEIAETADFIVGVHEIFAYWLQGGRVDMGFLGAAQIDRFANLNSTVIGNYNSPKVRLPGVGGASHIAAHAREIVVIARQTPKAFVARVDFVSTARPHGPTAVVTDLGVLESCPGKDELILTARHAGVTLDEIRAATGWPLEVATDLIETPAPTAGELRALRYLNTSTQLA